MNVRKFYASTTREALRKVRDALGENALILSNKQVAGGVEIMAVAESEMDALAGGPRREPPRQTPQAVRPHPDRVAATYSSGNAPASPTPRASPPPETEPIKVIRSGREDRSRRPDDGYIQPNRVEPAPYPLNPRGPRADDADLGEFPMRRNGARPPADPQAGPRPGVRTRASPPPTFQDEPEPPHRTAPPPLVDEPPLPEPGAMPDLGPPTGALSVEIATQISQEIRMLRGLLEGQLAGFAWQDVTRRDPNRITLLRSLLGAGFSPQLSRELLERMPADLDIGSAVKWVKAALQRNLFCLTAEDDFVEHGGVYALVGPTGVGKTTTVAKLAARATLKHGPGKVALLTTDSYRIGAHDQLKIYGRILGVPVYAVRDEEDLHLTLADLSARPFVLIDTVGMSQRDKRLVEQIAMLGSHAGPVQRILLVAANAQSSTLEDVVRAYGPRELAGCILTKIDEAVQVGGALDAIVRHRLLLCYLANGQRVPEDLHLANPLYVIDRAFRTSLQNSPLALADDEYPLLWEAEAENEVSLLNDTPPPGPPSGLNGGRRG